MTEEHLPSGLAMVPVGLIQPCPIQPRVNVSVDLVEKLSESIRSGRHQPLLEVEPAPGLRGHYQIVCGEQRWRAAKAAGLLEILVRTHSHLGYLERLEKQYEENRLRADLDLAEEAHCILLDKTIRDIAVAEQLLRDSLVPFAPLDEKRILQREEFSQHLDGLCRLLIKHKTHVVKSADGKPAVGPLSRWCETEKALGISESQRKAKLGVLRLSPEVLDELRELPSEHAIQISRLSDPKDQIELAHRAGELTHRQVRRIVDRLLQDPNLNVEEVIGVGVAIDREVVAGPLAFDDELHILADLCRQMTRLLSNLHARLAGKDANQVLALLADLRCQLDAFEKAA